MQAPPAPAPIRASSLDNADSLSRPQRIFVAGHKGMVGSAIYRALQEHNERKAQAGLSPLYELLTQNRQALDLTNQAQVQQFFEHERPDQVYLAAAKVGGIHANNTYPADFLYENLMVEANVIYAAFRAGVKKLLFLGSSCIYPRLAPQPMDEDALLTGPLEPTNEPYAVAKITGIKLCESFNRQYGGTHGVDYRSVMPTNLYGPGDNYHTENSHVIPALLRRFHEAKLANADQVTVWGSGAPRREFLHVDDLAQACLFVMNLDKASLDTQTHAMRSHLNVGAGHDLTIAELAQAIATTVQFKGRIEWDTTKPDGAPQKLMDSGRINALGWSAATGLEEGLQHAYQDFLSHCQSNTVRAAQRELLGQTRRTNQRG